MDAFQTLASDISRKFAVNEYRNVREQEFGLTIKAGVIDLSESGFLTKESCLQTLSKTKAQMTPLFPPTWVVSADSTLLSCVESVRDLITLVCPKSLRFRSVAKGGPPVPVQTNPG